MKLKELFFIVLCILPVFSFAEERKIDVEPERWNEKGKRSLSSVPVVSHDGNTLFIYSDTPLDNLQVQVKDVSGNIVYMENISIVMEQKHSFTMNSSFAGEYTIELRCDTRFLYGYFIL